MESWNLKKFGVYLTFRASNIEECFLTTRRKLAPYSDQTVYQYMGLYKENGVWNRVDRLQPVDRDGRWQQQGLFAVQTRSGWAFVDGQHQPVQFTAHHPRPEMKEWTSYVDRNKYLFRHQLLWEFGETELAYLDIFCEALATWMSAFTQKNRSEYFKGRTAGYHIESNVNAVMMLLKMGFKALGVKESAHGGVLFDGYAVGHIQPYVTQLSHHSDLIMDGRVAGFEEISKDKKGDPKQGSYYTEFRLPARIAPAPDTSRYLEHTYEHHIQEKIVKTAKVGGAPQQGAFESKNAEAALKKRQYSYVSEYGFRGDTRTPCTIRWAGGLLPNATRDDKQNLRVDSQSNTEKELLDNFTHQANWGSDYSGYVSVSRSLLVPISFLTRDFNKGTIDSGYVYVLLAREAVDVNETFVSPRYNMPSSGASEYELSVPGGIGWPDVVGWRKLVDDVNMKPRYRWDGPLFLSKDLSSEVRQKLTEFMTQPLSKKKAP